LKSDEIPINPFPYLPLNPLYRNYRIATDEYNFILQRKMDPEKNPRKDKKANISTGKWKNIGYWGDLSQLLASYARQVLRTEIGGHHPQRLIWGSPNSHASYRAYWGAVCEAMGQGLIGVENPGGRIRCQAPDVTSR